MSETSQQPEVSIEIRPNGPYRVTNLKYITNSKGERIECKEVVSLCRCGGSKTKPFCDGAHRQNGFTDEAN